MHIYLEFQSKTDGSSENRKKKKVPLSLRRHDVMHFQPSEQAIIIMTPQNHEARSREGSHKQTAAPALPVSLSPSRRLHVTLEYLAWCNASVRPRGYLGINTTLQHPLLHHTSSFCSTLPVSPGFVPFFPSTSEHLNLQTKPPSSLASFPRSIMSRSRLPLIIGVGAATGVGYYMFQAGGDRKVAEDKFDREAPPPPPVFLCLSHFFPFD